MKKLSDSLAAITFLLLLAVIIVALNINAENHDKKNPEQLTNLNVQLYQD